MAQIGNKQNCFLNGTWAAHVRKRTGEKRLTSKRRRQRDQKMIRDSQRDLV